MSAKRRLEQALQHLDRLKAVVNSCPNLSASKKRKLSSRIDETKRYFMPSLEASSVSTDPRINDIAKFLEAKASEGVRKVKTLCTTEPKKVEEVVEQTCRYFEAATYDLLDKLDVLESAYRNFIGAVAVSLVLIPLHLLHIPYMIFWFAGMVILPVVIAQRSLKLRKRVGAYLALSILPIPITVGSSSLYYGLMMLTHPELVKEVAASGGVTEQQVVLIAFGMALFGGLALYMGVKAIVLLLRNLKGFF